MFSAEESGIFAESSHWPTIRVCGLSSGVSTGWLSARRKPSPYVPKSRMALCDFPQFELSTGDFRAMRSFTDRGT
jgi:hypothetical protein